MTLAWASSLLCVLLGQDILNRVSPSPFTCSPFCEGMKLGLGAHSWCSVNEPGFLLEGWEVGLGGILCHGPEVLPLPNIQGKRLLTPPVSYRQF